MVPHQFPSIDQSYPCHTLFMSQAAKAAHSRTTNICTLPWRGTRAVSVFARHRCKKAVQAEDRNCYGGYAIHVPFTYRFTYRKLMHLSAQLLALLPDPRMPPIRDSHAIPAELEMFTAENSNVQISYQKNVIQKSS